MFSQMSIKLKSNKPPFFLKVIIEYMVVQKSNSAIIKKNHYE
jgi:hypothetical protein